MRLVAYAAQHVAQLVAGFGVQALVISLRSLCHSGEKAGGSPQVTDAELEVTPPVR